MRTWLLWTTLLLAAGSFACSSSADIDAQAAGGGGAGGQAGAAGGAGGGGQGGQGGQGGTPLNDQLLFDCGLRYACVQDVGHLGPISEDELRCGGELIASGLPGAVLVTGNPGPLPTLWEDLTVVLGDGTAIKQSRARCITEGDCMGRWGPGWTYIGPPELCDVQVQPEDIAGCGQPEGICSWSGGSVSNCVPLSESWSCDELPPL